MLEDEINVGGLGTVHHERVRLVDALFESDGVACHDGVTYNIEVFRSWLGYEIHGSLQPTHGAFWVSWFYYNVESVPSLYVAFETRKAALWKRVLAESNVSGTYNTTEDPELVGFIRDTCTDAILTDSFFRYQ